MNVTREGSFSAVPDLVRHPPDRDEVARAEQRDGVLVGDPLAVERLLEDLVDRRATGVGQRPSRRAPPRGRSGARDVRELADVAGHLEERVQAGSLARAEAVPELLEVAREEAGRVAVASRSPAARAARAPSARAARRRRARARGRAARPRRAPGAAQTANTIGRPVRSSQSRPRSKCGVGSSNALRSAASPIRSVASAPRSRAGRSPPSAGGCATSTTEVALSGVTATERTWPKGMRVTSWIESTAPSDETHSRGRMRRRSAFRAYSIDGIGAMSSSPSSSIRVSSVGTPDDLLDVRLEPVEDRRHVHVRDAAEPDHRPPPRRRQSERSGGEGDEPAPERRRASGDVHVEPRVSSEAK